MKATRNGASALAALLIAAALIVAVIGIFSLSQATMGAGLIALACLFGILGRIAQASNHQQQTLRILGAVANPGGSAASIELRGEDGTIRLEADAVVLSKAGGPFGGHGTERRFSRGLIRHATVREQGIGGAGVLTLDVEGQEQESVQFASFHRAQADAIVAALSATSTPLY